jgi:hypothetical protein
VFSFTAWLTPALTEGDLLRTGSDEVESPPPPPQAVIASAKTKGNVFFKDKWFKLTTPRY